MIAALALVTTSLAATPTIPSDEAAIVHALGRLTFGVTVRDVDRVKRIGLARWIDEQLNPSTIDDGQLRARLARLETLDLPSSVIARDYERPARLERLQQQRSAQTPTGVGSRLSAVQPGEPMQDPNGTPDSRLSTPDSPPSRPDTPASARPRRSSPDVSRAEAGRLPTPGNPPRPIPTEAQLKARLVIGELSEAKILRAVYSERQLEEVLVDFWFNHFNVFAGKGRTRVFIGEYERTAIRPHVLGTFRELLEATAKSPAMLLYLDNWLSSAAAEAQTLAPARTPSMRADGMDPRLRRRAFGFQAPRGAAEAMPAPAPVPQRMRGLNENYARELLELHTLGVDGGYTQADIVNVARAFTGWTISRRAARLGRSVDRSEDEGFQFAPAMHDAGEKVVLGQTITAGGGEQDGERVLDILATHPSTARFIATKLAQRFVSDQPPPALVDRAAARFRETNGNLGEVVRTIVTSPELFATEARSAKVKTPLEFVASALRATNADVQNAMPLTRVLRDLGMPVYFCQPPTGYDQTADTWVSSGALVSRMNFAVDLTSGRLRGTSLGTMQPDLSSARDDVTQSLLFGRISNATSATMAKAATPAQTLALAIGSPEFQRR